ncbi:Uncharacterised protein [Klebsiella pneumoniae]|nr:Uncharacterised protein [Klebsiella pneumoniae]SYC75341.1 Uncharacterised protein [Klebsiella pneumoniae]
MLCFFVGVKGYNCTFREAEWATRGHRVAINYQGKEVLSVANWGLDKVDYGRLSVNEWI